MSMRDDLAQLLVKRAGDHIQMLDSGPDENAHSVSIGLSMNWAAIADIILAAGWRPPARTIETDEELEGLAVGTVLVEGDHATPDEVEFLKLMTIPGVFHRFPDGWHVVSGYGARQVPLPATVLWEPEES